MESQIAGFIDRFVESDKTTDTFQFGCCYWFAFILFYRFLRNGAKIMYDEVANHFGTMINGRVYDITGDVTEQYDWIPWDRMDDNSIRSRITQDCIMF